MKKSIIAVLLSLPFAALAADGVSAVRQGSYAQARGAASVAVGMHAQANANLATAVGPHARAAGVTSQAYGSAAYAKGYSSTAIGKGTLAAGSASTAVGAHATAIGNSSVAMGLHAKSQGGQSTAVGQSSVARGDQSTAIGSGATTNARFSSALGMNSKANHYMDVAVGSFSETQKAVGTANATIKGHKYGPFAGSRPTSTVSVGKKGQERTITNVAAGRVTADSTDAINGSQLYAIGSQVSTNTNDIAKLTQNLYNSNLAINGLRQDIHDARREARAGVAGAIAIANLMQPYEAGQSAISIGGGTFRNEGAVALGASHITKNGKWGFKGGAFTDTRKHWGAGVAAAYFFGGVKPATPAPVVVKEVVREVVVREVQPAPKAKIRQ